MRLSTQDVQSQKSIRSITKSPSLVSIRSVPNKIQPLQTYWEMYWLPDIFNIFLSKFWRFWIPYLLQYGPNKYQTWQDFTNLGLLFLTIWFCLVRIINPTRHGLACTCGAPRSSRHIALLASLHRFTSKRGTTRSQVLLKCWRFFFGGGGWGGVAIFISKYDNTKTTRQQNCLLCKL